MKSTRIMLWKCSLLQYRFLWSNSAIVWFWGRNDWTDIFQNTFAFKNRGLSAKRTILERYSCRANLEQAEQFRHDSYELPKSLKYRGLWSYRILGMDWIMNIWCFSWKCIGTGNLVTAVTPQTNPKYSRYASVLIVNTHLTRKKKKKPVKKPKFLIQRRGWALESDYLSWCSGSATWCIYDLDWSQFAHLENGENTLLIHRIVDLIVLNHVS